MEGPCVRPVCRYLQEGFDLLKNNASLAILGNRLPANIQEALLPLLDSRPLSYSTPLEHKGREYLSPSLETQLSLINSELRKLESGVTETLLKHLESILREYLTAGNLSDELLNVTLRYVPRGGPEESTARFHLDAGKPGSVLVLKVHSMYLPAVTTRNLLMNLRERKGNTERSFLRLAAPAPVVMRSLLSCLKIENVSSIAWLQMDRLRRSIQERSLSSTLEVKYRFSKHLSLIPRELDSYSSLRV